MREKRLLKLSCPRCSRPGMVHVTTSEETVVGVEIRTAGWAIVGDPVSRSGYKCLSCAGRLTDKEWFEFWGFEGQVTEADFLK